ncbi:hypothetical protein [Azospirillum baldaniorum]|nr:hypothetical protein [Azospirillum baldaniorum]
MNAKLRLDAAFGEGVAVTASLGIRWVGRRPGCGGRRDVVFRNSLQAIRPGHFLTLTGSLLKL